MLNDFFELTDFGAILSESLNVLISAAKKIFFNGTFENVLK